MRYAPSMQIIKTSSERQSISAIAKLAANAFWNDPAPHVRYIWNKVPEHKVLKRYQAIFEIAFSHPACTNLVLDNNHQIKGFLNFVESKDSHLSVLEQLKVTPKFLFNAGIAAPRFLKFQSLLVENSPEKDSLYLSSLAVDIEAQGTSIGSQLLECFFSHHAQERLVYLETSKKRNVDLYKRHGFRIYQEVEFGDSPVWFMQREP